MTTKRQQRRKAEPEKPQAPEPDAPKVKAGPGPEADLVFLQDASDETKAVYSRKFKEGFGVAEDLAMIFGRLVRGDPMVALFACHAMQIRIASEVVLAGSETPQGMAIWMNNLGLALEEAITARAAAMAEAEGKGAPRH